MAASKVKRVALGRGFVMFVSSEKFFYFPKPR